MEIRAKDLTPEDLSRLPESMRELIRLTGMEAAVACINAFGGMELWIPKGEFGTRANARGMRAFERLEAICGKEAALAICKEYGGERLNIPRCHSLRSEMRARAIRRAFDDGASIADLVRRYGMTYRAIENILNRGI